MGETSENASISGVSPGVVLVTFTKRIQSSPTEPMSTPVPPPEPLYPAMISAADLSSHEKAGSTGLVKSVRIWPGAPPKSLVSSA
jgi:hypothetical protein